MRTSLLIFLFTISTVNVSYCQIFKPLSSDDLESIEKNKSIVIWRIKIIDKTSYFKNLHEENWSKYNFESIKERKAVNDNSNDYYFPTFEIFKDKDYHLTTISSVTNTYRPTYDFKKLKWLDVDSASILDELIVVKAKPGDYYMDRIRFLVSTVNDTFMTGTGYGTTGNVSIDKHYNIKAERKFSVKEESLVYLGRIEIEIDNFNDNPQVRFYINKESQKADMELFAKQYPQIKTAHENKLVAGKLKMLYIDNHSYRIGDSRVIPNREWKNEVNENYTLWKDGGEHKIKSSIETCPYTYVKLNYYEMPMNYKISFASKWNSGVVTEGYGLLLGNDFQNAYFFNGSGNGYAAVWHKKDGEFVINPIDWKENSIHMGNEDVKNNHLIEVNGGKVKYYTNSNLVGEFDVSIFTDEWIIGFQVCNKQSVSFSDLIVEEID